VTLASFDKVAGSADRLLGDEGNSLARQMRDTLRSAHGAADQLKTTLGDAQPAARQLSATTLPAADAALRELRATTRALRNITEKIDEQGAGALAGNSKLPDYEP
jgi:phospholipid/cholesterol/gamma-HCH transport system substrate-binding protein